MITYSEASQLLSYNPDTGDLTWKVNRYYRKTKGKIAGCSSAIGYKRIRVNGTLYLAHRLAWLLRYGCFPLGQIDHINGNRGDNRIGNLRDATNSINGCNTKLREDNTSGIMGVVWSRTINRWTARACDEGEIIYLGCTRDFFEACCLRKAAESKYNYHPNHGRTI